MLSLIHGRRDRSGVRGLQREGEILSCTLKKMRRGRRGEEGIRINRDKANETCYESFLCLSYPQRWNKDGRSYTYLRSCFRVSWLTFASRILFRALSSATARSTSTWGAFSSLSFRTRSPWPTERMYVQDWLQKPRKVSNASPSTPFKSICIGIRPFKCPVYERSLRIIESLCPQHL